VTPPRLATFLRALTVVFVTAWAVRSLIVSGDQVLNEHFKPVLMTPPWVTQAISGDGFEQSMVRLRGDLPAGDRVNVVWINVPDYYYAYFWSTFWLFPRAVTVVDSPNTSLDPAARALVHVRRSSEPPPYFPGFVVVTTYTFPDYIVTRFRRDA
jgi:hypothetical protein